MKHIPSKPTPEQPLTNVLWWQCKCCVWLVKRNGQMKWASLSGPMRKQKQCRAKTAIQQQTRCLTWSSFCFVCFVFFLLFIFFPRRKKKTAILTQMRDPVWQLRTKHSSFLVRLEKTHGARKAILQSIYVLPVVDFAGLEMEARTSSMLESPLPLSFPTSLLLLFTSNMNSASRLNQTQF